MLKKATFWKGVVCVLTICLVTAVTIWADEEATVTGTIEKTDQGIVLSADNGERFIVKGRDLSDMVGHTVQATGMLSEEKEGITITIISVEEISEQ